jgi:hypothetical protein
MNNTLREYLCAIALIGAPFLANAQAIQVDDVPGITKALMRGQAVRATFDLSKCRNTNSPNQPSPNVSGGLIVDPFNILPNGTIAFANTHFTLDPAGQPLTEIIRFRVNTDRSVNFSLTTFSMPSYQPLNSVALTCELATSVNFFVQLF